MRMSLKFVKGKDGQVIARLDSGKIVLVDKYSSTRPLPGEVWECEVVERDRFAIAMPVRKVEWTDWHFDAFAKKWTRENLLTGEVQTRPVTSPEDFPEEYVRKVYGGDREMAWLQHIAANSHLPVCSYGKYIWVNGYIFEKTDERYKEIPAWQAYQAGTNFEQVYRDIEDINNTLDRWNIYRVVVVKTPPVCPKCGQEVKLEQVFEDDADEVDIPSFSKESAEVPRLVFTTHFRGVCGNCGHEITQYQDIELSDETRTREMTIEKNTIRVTFQLTIRKVVRIYEGKRVVQLRTCPKITKIYCKCKIPKYNIKSKLLYDNKDIIWEGEVL